MAENNNICVCLSLSHRNRISNIMFADIYRNKCLFRTHLDFDE